MNDTAYPCRRCDKENPGKRHPGCHSNCEAYIRETAERLANKQTVFEARQKEKDVYYARSRRRKMVGAYVQV